MYVSVIRLFLAGLILFSSRAYGVDPRLDWQSFSTEHFYIHYAPPFHSLAEQAAAYAEQAHREISTKLHWQPGDKTHLVISDESDNANGYATPLTFNRSVIYVAPPDEANSLEDTKRWLQTLITHEYTHIILLDKAAGWVQTGRDIFGRNFYLFPNMFQPAWLTEGLATYMETDDEEGIGRGQSSFFRMMMRMEVAAGIKPLDQVNLPIRSWPLRTAHYLYGVYFYRFLKAQYGEAIPARLVDAYSDNLLPFFINSNAETVLHKDLGQLWQEFEVWLKKDFQGELDEIAAKERSGQRLSHDGYFRTQIRTLDDGRYFYIRSDGYRHSALIETSPEDKIISVTDINPGARIDVHPRAGVLISQPEYCDEYNRYYDLFVLRPGAAQLERLTHCGRYPSAAWADDGQHIIAVHLQASRHELQQLDARGEWQQTLWKGDAQTVLGQPDVSPDNSRIVLAVFRGDQGWNIEEFDRRQRTWHAITGDWKIDMYPQYSPDGDSILFSSERQGVFNIYRWWRQGQRLEQLTRVRGGAFKPVLDAAQGQLFYESYSSDGYDVSRLQLAQNQAVVSFSPKEPLPEAEPGLPSPVHGTEKPVPYSPWSSLRPRWWLPVIRVDQQQTELGLQTSGNDALGVHNYFAELSLSQLDGDNISHSQLGGFINYSYADRFVAGMQRRQSLILNNDPALFGGEPLAVARRISDEFYGLLVYSWPGVESSWRLSGGIKLSRDRFVQQQGGIDLSDFRDYLAGASLHYWDYKTYPRGISANDGQDIRLTLETNDLWGSYFSGEVYSLDLRKYIRLGLQQVFALRFVQAWGTDNPRPFELGGSGNSLNPLSVLSPVAGDGAALGRRSYGLRGYASGLEQLKGRRMQLLSGEWRFPLGGLVERGWMAPPLGLIQTSGRLFVDTGAAWDEGQSGDTYYTGLGAEIMGELNWFYGLSTVWRLGYAQGLDEQLGDSLIYVNLGGAF